MDKCLAQKSDEKTFQGPFLGQDREHRGPYHSNVKQMNCSLVIVTVSANFHIHTEVQIKIG